MLIFILILLLITLFFYARHHNTYWKRKHVKEIDPILLFGDSFRVLFGFENLMEMVRRFYNRQPNERYVGMYQLLSKVLIPRDPDLIKQLCIKDFENFMDHRQFLSDDFDPLWTRNLFNLRGDEWKEMRATLSPTFTATKMRAMFQLIDNTAQQFTEYFTKQNGNELIIDAKDSLGRYTTDAIANCAFGVKCDSLENRDNEFYLHGKEAMNFTDPIKSIKMFIFFLLPAVAKMLNFTLFSKKTSNFFMGIIKSAMKIREEQNIFRPDVIHLLMQAKKGTLKYEEDANEEAADAGYATAKESHIGKAHKAKMQHELTDVDVTAQAMIFFLAGYDTVSTILSFAFYELAMNTEAQEKLHKEIDAIYSECNGKLSYNHITKMKYLDMVLSETLRKWPPLLGLDRQCINKYTIEATRPGETTFNLNPGDLLLIPVAGLHYDRQYYQEPEKFDPERFSDANKHKIVPYTYFPFGAGPRNCIGSRFALLEMKTLMFYFLRKFQVLPCKETPIPIKISKKHFTLLIDGECKLLLRRRT